MPMGGMPPQAMPRRLSLGGEAAAAGARRWLRRRRRGRARRGARGARCRRRSRAGAAGADGGARVVVFCGGPSVGGQGSDRRRDLRKIDFARRHRRQGGGGSAAAAARPLLRRTGRSARWRAARRSTWCRRQPRGRRATLLMRRRVQRTGNTAARAPDVSGSSRRCARVFEVLLKGGSATRQTDLRFDAKCELRLTKQRTAMTLLGGGRDRRRHDGRARRLRWRTEMAAAPSRYSEAGDANCFGGRRPASARHARRKPQARATRRSAAPQRAVCPPATTIELAIRPATPPTVRVVTLARRARKPHARRRRRCARLRPADGTALLVRIAQCRKADSGASTESRPCRQGRGAHQDDEVARASGHRKGDPASVVRRRRWRSCRSSCRRPLRRAPRRAVPRCTAAFRLLASSLSVFSGRRWCSSSRRSPGSSPAARPRRCRWTRPRSRRRARCSSTPSSRWCSADERTPPPRIKEKDVELAEAIRRRICIGSPAHRAAPERIESQQDRATNRGTSRAARRRERDETSPRGARRRSVASHALTLRDQKLEIGDRATSAREALRSSWPLRRSSRVSYATPPRRARIA